MAPGRPACVRCAPCKPAQHHGWPALGHPGHTSVSAASQPSDRGMPAAPAPSRAGKKAEQARGLTQVLAMHSDFSIIPVQKTECITGAECWGTTEN